MKYMRRDPQTRIIESLTYCGQGMPIRLDIPFSEANRYNYIYAENNAFGGARHRFFYFITDVVYVAPNTVEIRVQLDVWQTYFKDVYVNRCYVERGHIGEHNYTLINEDRVRSYQVSRLPDETWQDVKSGKTLKIKVFLQTSGNRQTKIYFAENPLRLVKLQQLKDGESRFSLKLLNYKSL